MIIIMSVLKQVKLGQRVDVIFGFELLTPKYGASLSEREQVFNYGATTILLKARERLWQLEDTRMARRRYGTKPYLSK